jgi:putative transposase
MGASGEREILGIWAGDGGEGARFWLQVFSELKNRGVEDVLIAVCDGLKGLPEAITTTWERTVVQQCIVHLIRNSFRYAGRQHRDGIVKALKPVYTAPSEQAAKDRFAEFTAEWGQRYPAIVRLWESSWAEFVPFLEYDVEIRRVICTTKRDRVDQRALPKGSKGPRALSKRDRGPEMPIPRHQIS